MSSIPELPTDTLLPTLPLDDIAERIANVEGSHFTRLIKVAFSSNKARAYANELNSLSDLFAYADEEFDLLAGAIGATMVPHTFGIVPQDKVEAIAAEEPDGRDLFSLSDRFDLVEQYPQFFPTGYLLACEVAIIDPAPVDHALRAAEDDDYWTPLFELCDIHLEEQARADRLKLYDTCDCTSQFVYGTSREDPSAQAGLYIVDPDMYFE